MKTSVKLVVGP